MSYAARALLLTRGVRRSKHTGVIAAIGSELVRSGELSSALFSSLRDGFEERAEGEYGFAEMSRDRALLNLARATGFVHTVAPQLRDFEGGGPPPEEA